MTETTTPLQAARSLPKGAKFYRCAFQVNPAHYAETFRGNGHGMDECTYVQKLLDRCVELEIEVIAVTDHNHAGSIALFREEAKTRGITVFPGFEAAYEKTLRELQKSKIDGEEFVRLKKQIEALRPLRDQRTVLEQRLTQERDARRTRLVDWENAKAEQFRALERAAKKDSDAPLVVDQPEDDLDNRFITESIVPKMREEKRRRQFVFATHNANIPVLGDAELIVGLAARSDGNGALTAKHMGAIDSRGVRELVEEVLEGGRRAFELRRLKYGF